jgi:hypothetical protein
MLNTLFYVLNWLSRIKQENMWITTPMRLVIRRQSNSGGLRRKNWRRPIRSIEFSGMNRKIWMIKDVIAQMRNSMAEGRGDPRRETSPR